MRRIGDATRVRTEIALPAVSRGRFILPALLMSLFLPVHGLAQALPMDSQYQPLVSGMRSYQEGRYKEALESFHKASVIFPDDPDIPFYAGLTHLQLKQPEDAIAEFKKALKRIPAHRDANFHLGILLVHRKAYQEGLEHLEKVHAKEPGREDLGYFIGHAYYQLSQYEKALAFLEGGKTKNKNIEKLTLYHIALSKQQLGRKEEATALFKKLSIDPVSHQTLTPSHAPATLGQAEGPKKSWFVDLIAKVQYDDNVVLVPTTTDVYYPDDRERKSFVELLYLRGEYAFMRLPNWSAAVSYGIYQSITNAIREFDVQDHILSLDISKFGAFRATPYSLRVNYAYDYLLQDYKYLLQRHAFRPNLVLAWSPLHQSALQYAATLKEFAQTPILLEDDRDAVNHEAGFTHYLRFADAKHHIKAGYLFDTDFAQGRNWDYGGHRLVAGFQYTLARDIRLNMDYERKATRYRNANVFYGVKRSDTDNAFTVALSREIMPNWLVSLEYVARRNASNIAEFDYSRHLYSIGVSGQL